MATLTVKIIESCTLNGIDQGGTYSGFSNANITQIMKKNIKCAAGTELTLYQAADATATTGTGAAWFDEDSVKYVRITNLAGTSAYVYITIKNTDSDEAVFKLYGTESFLLHRHAASFEAIASNGASQTSVSHIDLVTVKAVSSAQAIELFIASTDAA